MGRLRLLFRSHASGALRLRLMRPTRAEIQSTHRSVMRIIGFFTVIFLALLILRACVGGADLVSESRKRVAIQGQQAQREQENALIPDMVPPLAAQAIDAKSIEIVAKIPSAKFCQALGKAIRTPKNSEYKRAMLTRAADEFSSPLKFLTQGLIERKQIELGMTQCAAIASWGYPERSNQSVGSYGVHDQWVYPANYLYFESGILTSYQAQN